MKFLKFEAQGNDFIFVCDEELKEESSPEIVKKLLERRFGIGADTLVVYNEGKNSLRFFNPDGTRAEICGNALLCYGLYLKKFKRFEGNIGVETPTGQISLEVQNEIHVIFDIPEFKFEEREFIVAGEKISCYFTASIGNPHCILLNPGVSFEMGPRIEKHPIFPGGTNVDFLFIDSKKRVKHRIWERGVGETYSCASGVVSSFCILRKLDLVTPCCKFESRGGVLVVEDKENRLLLKGIPRFVFRGGVEFPK